MDYTQLQPEAVWRHFFHICSIPHPSHHEEALAKNLLAWAQGKGLDAQLDAANNLVIRRKAAPGKEKAPMVIIQSHLDMVAQAAEGSTHDFLKDPIVPRLDPSDPAWLMATGTTLGADDGIGAAIALALLEDESLAVGPLECLFTSNEEDGMTGAKALEPGFVHGSILLNLDGEREKEITVGCAGSVRTYGNYRMQASRLEAGTKTYRVEIGGLLGGHSGVDIAKGRANASLSLAAMLSACGPFQLVSFHGGDASNAIPRSACAVVAMKPSGFADFSARMEAQTQALRHKLVHTDPGLHLSVREETDTASEGLSERDSSAFLALFAAVPNGLIAMDPHLPGAIKTSLNLGVANAAVKEGFLELETAILVRSSSDQERDAIAASAENHLAGLGALGYSVASRRPSSMAAWAPNLASPLLATTKAVYRELFGHEAEICTTHGGLECAYFKPRYPHWDMVSFGPDLEYPHSPGERVRIASVGTMYELVKRLLVRLS